MAELYGLANKIEPGYYKMRNGYKCRIVSNEVPGDYALAGWADPEEYGGGIQTWMQSGKYSESAAECGFDIVDVWREPLEVETVLWVRPGTVVSDDASIMGVLGIEDYNIIESIRCNIKVRITLKEIQ